MDGVDNLVEKLWHEDKTPPSISNEFLSHLQIKSGIRDPFASAKTDEFMHATLAYRKLRSMFSDTLAGFIQLSALGNSTDFFTNGRFDFDNFVFSADMAKIEKAIYTSDKDILMIGDNVSDLVFDRDLVDHLENKGKHVYYAVREGPVQNDLCLDDIENLGITIRPKNIVSTGAAHVGLTKEYMSDTVRKLWKGKGLVIAKGMGNFETISEFHHERPVIYIMKVKCLPVSRAIGEEAGTYIAKLGGE